MPILRAYLLGAAASAQGGEAMVVIVEPNGDESRVVCRLKGSLTEIDFFHGHHPEYFHERYGGPNAFSSVVRRAALGISSREDTEEVSVDHLLRADFLQLRTTEAFEFARKTLGGRVRPGTSIPRLADAMAAAALVLEYGGDEDETIAALLLETPAPALSDLGRIFGERVARLVEGGQKLKSAKDGQLVSADSSLLLILCAAEIQGALILVSAMIGREASEQQKVQLAHLKTFTQAAKMHPECTDGATRAADRLSRIVKSLEI